MVWSRSLLTSSRLPAPLLKRFYAAPSPVTRASSYIPPTTKFTKIMCTVGPASESHETLTQLIERGARVFRLNFSHGDFESHGQRLDAIRAASRALQIPVAVCGDLQGPKIRVGTVPTSVQVGDTASRSGGGLIQVHAGDVVVLSATATEAHIRDDGTPVLSLTYKEMVHEVEAGHLVLINDGAIRMRAICVDGDELQCQVLVGGAITSGKGINLPESNIKAPAITDKDWACVEWAMAHDLDYVALSFVRNANEVNALKAKLSETDGHRLHIISKIEKPQAVDNLHQIVEASDGVMVARGDLGVEMELATVPIIQKHIIETCQLHGKPCIIATQMLESMITSVIPTRAEASDVANAIFDGADAVMLSAESATGAHPALVVETMGQIIEASEGYMRKHVKKEQHAPPTRTAAAHHLTASLAYGAWHVVQETKAKMVVCWSQHGNAARFLSQYDFTIPILAFSEIERSVHQMALFNGVTPVHMAVPSGTASFIDATEALLLQNKLVTKGDMVLFLGGRPLGKSKSTNAMILHEIGSKAT